jgi:hypothetical protein
MSRGHEFPGQITSSDQLRYPFSLCCVSCDAGCNLTCPEHAIAAGWSNIIEDADGIGWNYIGVCPTCQCEEDGE